MSTQASDLARRLAERAELVCRHYLSNGRRVGRYWIVGDVRNTPGRSMFVRLHKRPGGKGAAGKWTDGATGEHGDLLDIIRESCGFLEFGDVLAEARRFLSLPRPKWIAESTSPIAPATGGSPESARRLFAMSKPIHGTIAETYLPVVEDAPLGWPHAKGFVTDVIAATVEDPKAAEFYVAGPPAMVDAVRALLRRVDVPITQVHYDSFG
jgi:hypothetical protein